MPTISWSKAKLWRRCHKAYDYKYNQRLVPKRPPLPLLKGNIIHEMLDAAARKADPFEILQRLAKENRQLILSEPETYGSLIEDCRTIFEGYQRHYAEDAKRYEVLESEHLVEVDLASELKFVGYIDKVWLDREGRRWIVDHKTHKNIPNEEARFSDLQLAFYVWAYNQNAKPSERVSGIIWDYLRTKLPTMPEVLKSGQLSKRDNIDTDAYTYLKAIKINNLDPADYADILERLENKTSTFFLRVSLPSPPATMVESVVEDMRNTALEIKHLGDADHIRNLTRDCSFCQFYDLCHSELRGLDADFIRKSKYTIQESTDNGDEEIIND